MKKKIELESELDRLNRINEQLSQRQREAETIANLSALMSEGTALSQQIVDTLVEKVLVFPDNHIEVVWKIIGLFDEKTAFSL